MQQLQKQTEINIIFPIFSLDNEIERKNSGAKTPTPHWDNNSKLMELELEFSRILFFLRFKLIIIIIIISIVVVT